VPVLEHELVEVREWVGRGEGWQTTIIGVPRERYRLDYDPADGNTVIAVWIAWQNRADFYSSRADDRHYVLGRSAGILKFPTPPSGMTPPAGATIRASYSVGGGLAANVPVGTITELHTGASYVQSVTNPFPASGGSQTETPARARARATQRLRH